MKKSIKSIDGLPCLDFFRKYCFIIQRSKLFEDTQTDKGMYLVLDHTYSVGNMYLFNSVERVSNKPRQTRRWSQLDMLNDEMCVLTVHPYVTSYVI